jgi:uncharacterized protein (TIGR02145 family)
MKRLLTFLVSVCVLFGTVLINSCKKDPVVPTLTTTAVTNITINSVTSGGSITSDGRAAVTARGVCWGATASPVASGSHTSDGTGIGSFVSNITGLTPNTTYHLRAYATNSAGTAYGSDVTFTTTPQVVPTLTTTAVSAITLTTAVSGGNITADGNAAVTAKGVCWATTATPTITNFKTSDGTGTGSFVSNLTGLVAGTTYYLRAYATNSVGTAYGNEISFVSSSIAAPTVTTTAISSIALTSAVSGGNVTADGGGTITARGVCWATTTAPTTASAKTSETAGIGSFVSTLTPLLAGTTYYVRAYATNSAGTSYGNELTFTTLSSAAALTTAVVTSVTQTSAVSGGTITSNGGAVITVSGICWSLTANPTTADSKTTDGSTSGTFSSSMTGLSAGTTYHVRAYATNSIGTAYGNDISFTTLASAATLTTTAATGITQTAAVSGGTITSNGGAVITVSGICWSQTANPTTADSKTTDGTATGTFTGNLTGLSAGTTYHIRAYATNSVGTAYGNDVSFTTLTTIPTLTTTAASAITQTTAVSGGTITSNGGSAITVSGICWSLTASPSTTDSKTTDGTLTGTFTGNLTGLTAGTLYHVRAYATNGAGTAYGNDISFTTTTSVATLTTTAVSAITQTTAVSGGTITSNGGSAITVTGICWSTTASPSTTDAKTIDGALTGTFTGNLTGLTPGTIYHVRAYAINGAGTAYGNDVQFTSGSASVPTLTTTVISAITNTGATSGGDITSDGGGTVTARGVCYATTATPTILNSVTTNGAGIGPFTSPITGLQTGTVYYVRAYATNAAGTGYGAQQIFSTTFETGILIDQDGNHYTTAHIGAQWWMTQNLQATSLSDVGHTPIVNIVDPTNWMAQTTPARCWYNNNEATYGAAYGSMYNWFTVATGNLCPTGWHVPTDAEFQALEVYLGMATGGLAGQVDAWGWRGTDQGTKMKSTTLWLNAGNGTNTSGFNAPPGGYRFAGDGSFANLGDLSYWWTATEDAVGPTGTGWYRRMDGNQTGVYRATTAKTAGKYVRCVQN